MTLSKTIWNVATPAQVNWRDTLFGDMPIDRWIGDGSASQELPWNIFAAARTCAQIGDRDGASAHWRHIVDHPELEPRHLLQAWHFLRLAGQPPPPGIAKQVLGVVVETTLEQGVDLLAAYADYSARHYSSCGKIVIWDHANDSMNEKINALLVASSLVVAHLDPWPSVRPPAPPKGQTRLSFLTPGGPRFTQASTATLSKEVIEGEVLYRAGILTQGLMGLSNEPGV